jgi:hypothetical protein
MEPVYVPLLSALVGALIGSISSIAVIFIQTRASERRERIKQALTLALEDLKIKMANANPGTDIYPLSIYLHHELAILKAIEDNDVTPKRLRKIAATDDKLIRAVKEIENEIRSKWRAEQEQRK